MPSCPSAQATPTSVAFQIVRESVGEAPRLEHQESPLAARASAGGQARAVRLTAARRREIAKRGAEARWAVREDKPEYGD